jgi:copper resistance protein B
MTLSSLSRNALLVAIVLATSSPVFAQANWHAGHQHPTPAPEPAAKAATHAPHDHDGSDRAQELPPFIPPLTDEDRKAAFPDVEGHTVSGNAVNYFVLFDQLEWQGRGDSSGVNLDSRGWVGRDRDRVWFRAEGDGEGGRVGEAHAHVLYGRRFARWWDVVAGVRQDVQPGPAQTWAAVGVQGIAPYWFEVEATAYVGASGRTHARFEVEYELLLTNRLILQPLVEAEVFGKSDPQRGIGAGLATTDAGFRVRYEWRRELAPYVGVTWNRKWGKAADFAEAAGEDRGSARFVSGLRLWF